jgi:hypothetical protein
MAIPPTPPSPPPPGYFEKNATAAAAATFSTDKPSSFYLVPISPSTMASSLSFTDTIVDVSPFIPITLDLPIHNYYHWRYLFNVHLSQCNLLHHVAADSVPRPNDPCWVKDDLAIIQWIYTRVSPGS